MKQFGPYFQQSDDPTEFAVGPANDGSPIWASCDIPDDPEDFGQRHMAVGVGDPDNGGTVIRMSGPVAVRLARSLLSSASLTVGASADFGFIHHALGSLPYRTTDSTDSEAGVYLDPDFSAYAAKSGIDLDTITGFEWVQALAAWDDERRRAYEAEDVK